MISISVTSYNGASTAPLSAHFDETGGNIGRAENNELVLPDPERTISRVHAQVVYRNGRYAIVDRGSNPISVNGRPLGNGQEAMIGVGDELNIGGYVMRVEAASANGGAAAAADPFADFAGLAAAPSPHPRAASGPVDPLAGFGSAPASSAPAGPASSAGGIPQDWDPFAPDAPAGQTGGHDLGRSLGQVSRSPGSSFGLDVGGRAEPLIPEFGQGGSSPGGGDTLDSLFGLGAPGGSDPLAGSALNQAAALPNMAANADPMKSLNSITRGSATAAADTTSELSSPFMLPPMVPAAGRGPAQPGPAFAPTRPMETIPQTQSFLSGFSQPQPGVAAAAVPAGATSSRKADAVAPPGSVLSWNHPSGDTFTVIGRGVAAPSPAGASMPNAQMTGAADLALDFDSLASPPTVLRPRQAPAASATPASVAPSPVFSPPAIASFGLAGTAAAAAAAATAAATATATAVAHLRRARRRHAGAERRPPRRPGRARPAAPSLADADRCA